MKPNEITIKVFNGKKFIKVKGVLLPFKERTQLAKGLYKNVKLFRSKRRWWLYYNHESLTGSFKTRKEAAKWFNNSGR
jgi:hypothetical protein